MSKPRKSWSLKKAVLIIFMSVVLVSGSAAVAIFYYKNLLHTKKDDSKYTITKIIQTGTQKEALRTSYLAELMGLSVDNPTNLYSFNVHVARENLLNSPVIKHADVQLVLPDTVYVDYTVRKPIAILRDVTNAAVDDEGYIFPIAPFFTPKKLPEVYYDLGLSDDMLQRVFGLQLKGKKTDLFMELLERPELEWVSWIDVSRAYSENYGKRQIVVTIKNRTLRLTAQNYVQELRRYLFLRKYLHADSVIDFRVSDIAYVYSG
jgi:hypothetical protein